MSGDPTFYSTIPQSELPSWDDGDLSGAMFDEAVELAGGWGFTTADVAKLPLGFRASLAVGRVNAHVLGDGVACAVWNDDGVELFALAARCLESMGEQSLSRVLVDIVSAVERWQRQTGKKPRSRKLDAFTESPLGVALDGYMDAFEEVADAGFATMMAYLRAKPQVFKA